SLSNFLGLRLLRSHWACSLLEWTLEAYCEVRPHFPLLRLASLLARCQIAPNRTDDCHFLLYTSREEAAIRWIDGLPQVLSLPIHGPIPAGRVHCLGFVRRYSRTRCGPSRGCHHPTAVPIRAPPASSAGWEQRSLTVHTAGPDVEERHVTPVTSPRLDHHARPSVGSDADGQGPRHVHGRTWLRPRPC